MAVMNISAAILAGGKASRLNGLKKTNIFIEKQAIFERQMEALSEVFEDIFLISNDDTNFSNLPVFADYYKNIGPIAGIHAALKNATTPYVFVVSCDLPFLNSKFIELLTKEVQVNSVDAIIPKHSLGIEPLHAIYSISVLTEVENQIKQGTYAIRNIYNRLKVKWFEVNSSFRPDKMFFNINYPEDILKAEMYAKQTN